MLHIPNIFGRTPTPPPPTGDSTASAADPTPSSGPPTPQVPGGFKEDSKQLGHEVTSEPTSVPNAGNVSTLPTTHLEESREVGKGLNSALPPVQEPIQKDPGLESSNPPGYVNKLEEEKTPIPFGEKGIDFSTPAEKDSLSTEDPIGIPSGYKASEMLDESNSPGYGAQAGTSFQDSAMRSGGEIGESRDLAQSAPPMHSAFGGDHQEQQLPLDSKNEKALASNFGEMSMEEKRVADKQPLVDDRGGREEKGLGGAPPIDQTRSQDDQLGHSGGPAGAGAEGLAGTGGHDVKAHQRDDHLNPNVGAVKTGHSPASSTKTSITNGGEEERSVDEAGNKKPKKKVGLGDKLAGAFEKFVGTASHNEKKKLHGETRQHEGKEAADAVILASESTGAELKDSTSYDSHSKGAQPASGIKQGGPEDRIHKDNITGIETGKHQPQYQTGMGATGGAEVGGVRDETSGIKGGDPVLKEGEYTRQLD